MIEDDLISGIKEGDNTALSYFIKKYRRTIQIEVHKYIWNYHDAEDVIMETIEDAWQKIGLHQKDKYKLSTWVQSIARNNSIDFRRRSRPVWWHDAVLLRESGLNTPEEDMWFKEGAMLIDGLINGLTPKNKQMVIMRSEGYSFREIAHKTKGKETSVRTRVWRHQMEVYEKYKKICEYGLK